MPTGTIFNIQHYTIHDGPGIRVTVFLYAYPAQSGTIERMAKKTVWLRVPIMPTITATQKNIIDILEYVTKTWSALILQQMKIWSWYDNSLPNPAFPYRLADDGIYR